VRKPNPNILLFFSHNPTPHPLKKIKIYCKKNFSKKLKKIKIPPKKYLTLFSKRCKIKLQNKSSDKLKRWYFMSIQEQINEMREQGEAQFFVVYANIGNDSDELIVCDACDADNAGAEVIEITYVEHGQFLRTAIITAEVKGV
jgi:hypothetical protein